MRKNFTLMTLLAFCVFAMQAQVRYVDEIFDDVEVNSGVVYGVNATLLFLPVVGEAIPQALEMDIYTPAGDTETDRPVVLLFHTGNFLPNVTNGQISGTRTDSSAVEICTQLARRGYVAASADYRLGWNPLAATQPERALGLIQAAYRGVQDGRTAIRYMRRTVEEEGNPYGINPDKVALWGNGTGGYLVLGTATLDDYNEIVTTTNGPGKFLLDLDGDGVPETPMIVPFYHGDINGLDLTVAPDGAFGFPAGDTTNYVNHAGYDNDFQLSINVGGALGDVSWIDENTPPTISIQSPFDIFAPYDDAVLIVPTTGDPIVQVQGAQQIGAAQTALGNNDVWADGVFDDAITQEAIDNSATAGHDYYEGVYPFINPPNSNMLDEGVVIEWWDPSALSPPILPDFPNGVPWNMLPHPSGGTFHDQGLALNEGMSADKARANIEKIMGYVLPRACFALDLPCQTEYMLGDATEDLLDNSLVSITPNPVSELMQINSDNGPIQSIQIYNMNGQLVEQFKNLNQESIAIPRTGITSGMYIVKLEFDNGFLTKKVNVK